MNILILTGRFGAGHIKAAEAIREEIRHTHKSARVNIIDFTEYLFPRVADAIYHGFAFLTSHCGRHTTSYPAANFSTGKCQWRIHKAKRNWRNYYGRCFAKNYR